MLHPSCRTEYFDTHWKKDKNLQQWILPTKASLQQLYNKEYDNKAVSERHQPSSEPAAEGKKPNLLNALSTRTRTRTRSYRAMNSIAIMDHRTPVSYYRKRGTSIIGGRCKQMAYDFLSIPAMSSDCERLFSGAKLTITPQRNRIKANIIEAIEVMNTWLQRDVTKEPGSDDNVY